MATRRKTAPRKEPRQQRSRALVDTLLEATARILKTRRLEDTTTNEIARMAGVSVGSLYQYFPSKEALAAALIERKVELDLQEVAQAAARMEGQPFEAVVRESVRVMLDLHRRDRGLMRALLELVPKVGRYSQVREAAAQGRQALRLLLEAYRPVLRDMDLDLAAFIIGRSLEELIHAAVQERPELLEDQRFADELTHLVLAYVRAPRA
jgi:AcrR family transcriptional regulator